MKRAMQSATAFILILLLCSSCTYTTHADTHPYYLADVDLPKLTASQSVAIRNASPKAAGAEEVLCNYARRDFVGSLYNFTESSISSTKNALQRNNISLDDKATKYLALNVDKATCERGSVSITLKTGIGNGAVKECSVKERCGHIYAVTRCFEKAMELCVNQMLREKDIVEYLAH